MQIGTGEEGTMWQSFLESITPTVGPMVQVSSAWRQEEAMSMHIVEDDQRSDRRATPCALRVPAARLERGPS